MEHVAILVVSSDYDESGLPAVCPYGSGWPSGWLAGCGALCLECWIAGWWALRLLLELAQAVLLGHRVAALALLNIQPLLHPLPGSTCTRWWGVRSGGNHPQRQRARRVSTRVLLVAVGVFAGQERRQRGVNAGNAWGTTAGRCRLALACHCGVDVDVRCRPAALHALKVDGLAPRQRRDRGRALLPVRQAWRAGRLVDPQLAVAAVAGAGTQDSASALLSTAEVLLRHICPHIVRGAAHHAAPGRQAGRQAVHRPVPAPHLYHSCLSRMLLSSPACHLKWWMGMIASDTSACHRPSPGGRFSCEESAGRARPASRRQSVLPLKNVASCKHSCKARQTWQRSFNSPQHHRRKDHLPHPSILPMPTPTNRQKHHPPAHPPLYL